MRLFITLLLIAITSSLVAQVELDTSTTRVRTSFLISSAKKYQELLRVDSIKTEQIAVMNAQITDLELVNEQNTSIIELKDQEIGIYRSALSNFVDLPDQPKKKWYQTPTFNYIAGFLSGSAVIFVSAEILTRIN